MLSRALSLATVTLLIGCLTAVAVRAVENLEAGKSPAQIFAGTCNACHKSPRGLLRSVPPSSLPGFLRQHYTTSSDMASVLASYLVANGGTDTRSQGKEAKQGKDGAKEGAKEGRQEARAPADQGARQQPRLPRAGETPDLMRPDAPAQATIDKGKKDKGKKGRPEEPARTEPAAEPPKETAKGDDSAKPADEPKNESAKVEPSRENPSEPAATRPDPVPGVTPAPSTTAAAPATSSPAPAAASPAGASSSTPPVQALDAPSASAAEQSKPVSEPKPVEPKPPAVAASPPVPPAGPPAVPISQ
jgi:hypothetical protein